VAEDPADKVYGASARSEVLRAVAAVRHDGGRSLGLGGRGVRPLLPEEVARLEQVGNRADDWGRVQVADPFDPHRVRDSSFHGEVILGRLTGRARVAGVAELPAGVYRSTVANAVIGDDALVRDVRLLSNYALGAGAVLLDCGSITCDAGTAFGNGTELPLGVEVGGREVWAYAEMGVGVAATVARTRRDREFLDRYQAAVAEYVARAFSRRGIAERGAVVRNTPRVHNTYLGAHAQVDGATLLADSTLLSGEDEATRVESGACVTNSLLQWGSRVATLAVVDRSVLTEYSSVERHGKVSGSLLGPNTAVAGGEVTASLLGPFVNCRHQSLLIATLWPEGRGNVAYGANVGSNHTSRSPDQEFRPGEGAFLGLGVNVKFPADYSRAPYTVLACGVTTPPQRVTFPFSLVNSPAERSPGVPPAYNEIIPAWQLTDNLFALRRAEEKHRARNKARRERFRFEVFRPDTVDLMRDACRRLEVVRTRREFYTGDDIEGIGKNFLREPHRRRAVGAYRFFTRYYALLGLKERVQTVLCREGPGAIGGLLTMPAEEQPWEHQRQILSRVLGVSDVVSGLSQLPGVLEKVAQEVERSKARDDERGPRIIDDYCEAHVPAAKEGTVERAWEETRRLQREVRELLQELRGG
jgi:hypothetical protein